MANVRLIARLDIKGPNLIKGVQLEGLRVIGDPQEYARRYYEQGADELLYIDIVPAMLGSDGQPVKDLFVKDMLHMSPAGYKIWTEVVGPHLGPGTVPRAHRP